MKYRVTDYIARTPVEFTFDNPFSGRIGEVFDKFHSIYEPDLIVTHPARKPRLTRREERACRFCIRAFPDVTFRKTAHVFPQLMGNKNIIHDCECDSCNELFGTYEDSFSKFMGMTRTTEFMKGQAGIPSFMSGDGKFAMRYGIDSEGKNLIKISGEAQEIKEVDNGIEFRALKQPYVPLHVMKCLYKIGYSMVDAVDLPHFNPTRKIITSNELDHLLTSFAGVVRFTFSHPAHSPMAVRYKKKKSSQELNHPSTIITLHFGRYTYQFFLVDLRDTFMFRDGQKFDFLFAPPPFENDHDKMYTEKIELYGTAKRENEMDAVVFTFDWWKE